MNKRLLFTICIGLQLVHAGDSEEQRAGAGHELRHAASAPLLPSVNQDGDDAPRGRSFSWGNKRVLLDDRVPLGDRVPMAPKEGPSKRELEKVKEHENES